MPSCRRRRSHLHRRASRPVRPHRRRARPTRAPEALRPRKAHRQSCPTGIRTRASGHATDPCRRHTRRAAGHRQPLHRSRADDERATPGKQPTRSHSARPREHPDLYPDSEPRGQRVRHAGQRRGNRSPRQLQLPCSTITPTTLGSPAESRDIGRDITGNAMDGSSDDRTQDANCDPHNGCCGVPSLAGGCCDVSLLAGVCLNTDAVELSPIDIARILDAIFGNASGNADVTAQYQGDAVQYRPINISVSIRISSPGNDGPVEQTNLVQVQASVSVEVAPGRPTTCRATRPDDRSRNHGRRCVRRRGSRAAGACRWG